MKALIDGDILLYAAGFSVEQNIYTVCYSEGEIECENKREANALSKKLLGEICTEKIVEPENHAVHNVRTMINKINNAIGGDYQIYITGKENYRVDVAPYYKAHRDKDHKPFHYDALKDYLVNKHKAIITDGEEADDAMGIAQSQAESYEETCICTTDKDLMMIAGHHYNWNKDTSKRFITQEMADNFFYTQLLTGDATDNIPGLYKLTGEKAYKRYKDAVADLGTPYEKWDYVQDLYLNHGASTDQLIEIARLLWIRREKDETWFPPNEET